MNTIISQLSRATITMPESFQALKIIKAAKAGHRQDDHIVVLKPVSGLAQLMCQPALLLPGIVQRMNIINSARKKEKATIIMDKADDAASSPKTCPISIASSNVELAQMKGSPLAALDYFNTINTITGANEADKVDKKKMKKTNTKKDSKTTTILGSMALGLMLFAQFPSQNKSEGSQLPAKPDSGLAFPLPIEPIDLIVIHDLYTPDNSYWNADASFLAHKTLLELPPATKIPLETPKVASPLRSAVAALAMATIVGSLM